MPVGPLVELVVLGHVFHSVLFHISPCVAGLLGLLMPFALGLAAGNLATRPADLTPKLLDSCSGQ